MLTQERKRRILERLRSDGRLVAKDFASELGLSEDTIRRDLREMAGEGLLARVHGGALPLSPDLPDLATRHTIDGVEKDRLAARAASLIQPGMLVFIDGGTTHAALIRHLPREAGLTVATHSPTIAAALGVRDDIEVLTIGGRLYRHSMVAVGAIAAGAIARLRPDIAFVGVTAVHPRHGLTTGDADEAAIKALVIAQSRQSFVLATAAKLDAASPHLVAPVGGVGGIILPATVPAEPIAALQAAGAEVLLA
jgi:DeoR/GlpR family transcriptional regulator of sugar metabolism